MRGAIVPWRRTRTMPDDSTTTIESFGTGDAPASITRVVRNGETVMTINEEWELWQRQWNLVRRETTTPAGRFHELVEVNRTGRTGSALLSPAVWAQWFGSPTQFSPAYDIYGDDDAGGCPTCAALQAAVDDDSELLTVAAALADAECAIPTPFGVPVCIAALAGVWVAEVRLERAVQQRDDCKCPPKKPITDDCSTRGATGHALTASQSCSGTGGGGGGGSTQSGHNECTYYFEYDLISGDILYSELLGCRWVAGG